MLVGVVVRLVGAVLSMIMKSSELVAPGTAPAHGPQVVPRSLGNPGGTTQSGQRVDDMICERGELDDLCGAPRLERNERRYGDSIHFAVWIDRRAVVVEPERSIPGRRRIEKARFEPARGRAHRLVHDHFCDDQLGHRVYDRHERVVVAWRGNRIKIVELIET